MQAGEVLESRYQLIGRLQTSWLALDRASGQECLLKPKSGFSDPRVAAWLGQVRHTGLPRLLGEVALSDVESYWVFEFIAGQTFRELAGMTGQRMPIDQLLPLIVQAARILAFIHDQDGQMILHLDIKPENLLLADNGLVSLIDFGAARMIQSTVEQKKRLSPLSLPGSLASPASVFRVSDAKQIALTPEYAAPELLSGHPCTGSDVFALALMMLHLLTGQPPSDCRSRPLPELLACATELPDGLRRLFGRCLHTDPEFRLNSAVELACELASEQGLLAQPAASSDPAPLLPAVSLPVEKQLDHAAVPILCIWDGAEMGCEMAAVLAESNQVMVIDADLLNPQADLLLGVENCMQHPSVKSDLHGLDLVLSEEQRGHLDLTTLNHLAKESRIRQVRVLTTRCGLDQYEYYQLDSMNQILQRARLTNDLVIVLCSPFVFDAFTCLSLQTADLVLVPLTGDSGSFRKCNRAIEFLCARQQLDACKIKYVAFSYDQQLDLSWGTMDELCGGRLLGSVSACDRRRRMKSGSTPYAAAIDRPIRQEYLSLIRRINIPNLRKKVNV